MIPQTKFKVGDTFDVSDQLVMSVEGVRVADFTGMTGTSQIRSANDGTLVANLAFTWLDIQQGLYRARYEGSTQGWPVGDALHDVQLTTASGDVISTDTEMIRLVPDVTRAI